MILSDFRYQDPWAKAEEAFTLPKLFHQSQLEQRENQQAEANRKALDGLLDCRLPINYATGESQMAH